MFRRIYALFLRQIYLIRQSPPRLITYVFWPTVFMLVWGFFNKFLYQQTGSAQFALATLLGANLLSSIMERSNLNIMMGFLEDVWARNIGNILISPIRTAEFIIGLILNGLVGMGIGVGSAILIAYFIFDYNVFHFGLHLAGFTINLLLTGWGLSMLIIAVVIRHGASGEMLGWMLAFLITPFICVYYPVSVLPVFMQHISWLLPPTYVFEGLRHLTQTGNFDWDSFYNGLWRNIIFFAVSLKVFVYSLNKARQRGGLLSMSE